MGQIENTLNYDFLDKECREVNGITLLNKGHKAFKEVPGLYKFYLQGVILTLLCAALFFTALFFTLYRMYILPFLDSYLSTITNWAEWLSYLAMPVYWIIVVICWSFIAYISLKLSTVVLGLWIDALLSKIMRHFREVPELPFSLKRMLKIMLAGLKLSISNMLLTLFFFLLGFLPFIGPFLAFIGLSCSSGFDIKTPYVLLLGEDDPEKHKGFRLKKGRLFKMGFIHGLITLIPIIGWIMLPASLLIQMAGYTYYCEEKWHKRLIS